MVFNHNFVSNTISLMNLSPVPKMIVTIYRTFQEDLYKLFGEEDTISNKDFLMRNYGLKS